jgi:hemolysin activation/secretion protein
VSVRPLVALTSLLIMGIGPQLSTSQAAQAPAAAAAPAAAPANASSPTTASPAADAKPVQRFDVHEYRVLGNTVMSNRAIEGVLYPLLGDGETISDVDAARAALENAYHTAGFATVFVDVPPQEIEEGVVRLRVTEGRTRVRTISGARYFSEGKILAELPATQPGTVPNLIQLQAQLATVNAETTDKSVSPVLKAGPVPGTMDLALKVDDHLPLHGGVDFNNQYTPDTKTLRATVSLSYNNLFGELDSLTAQYTFTPQKTGQVSVVNANYGFRPIGDGIRPSISFTNSSSSVATIGTLGVLGDGQIYGARISMPIVFLSGNLQSLVLGLDYKHFRNTINLDSSGAQASTGTTIQPISYLNASLGYLGAWQITSKSGAVSQLASFDLTLNAGPRGLANRTSNFADTRFMARGNYIYFRSDASFTQKLPANMQLILRASGQAALEPLVTYEQDSIAGSDGVRGYLEAEVLSDTAFKGTIQLQSPQLAPRGFVLGDGFVFFDAGRGRTLDALSGEPGATNLRSWGLGLDLFPGHAVTGALTFADPLRQGPRTKANEPRVLFDVKGSF